MDFIVDLSDEDIEDEYSLVQGRQAFEKKKKKCCSFCSPLLGEESLAEEQCHVNGVSGKLRLTPLRLLFVDAMDEGGVSLPLSCVESWEAVSKDELEFHARDVRVVRVKLSSEESMRRLTAFLESRLFCPARELFALQVDDAPSAAEEEEMAAKLGLRQGWAAMGVFEEGSLFRESMLNKGHQVCESYPERLVVLGDLSDEEYSEVAAFRSRGRLPVLSWCAPHGQLPCVLRCSQPRTGLARNTCKADERLAAMLRELVIVDARPRAAAVANSARGGGSEVRRGYRHAEVRFVGCANIHSIRKDASSLRAICVESGVGQVSMVSWAKHTAQWLDHVCTLLKGGVAMMTLTHPLDHSPPSSVLLHW